MGFLSHDKLLELREAVISAGLGASRDVLIVGIGASFVAGLPDARAPGEQVLCDLDAMNAAGVLADGSVPLLVWLANAVALAGPRKEATLFEEARQRCLAALPAAPSLDLGEAASAKALGDTQRALHHGHSNIGAYAQGDNARAEGYVYNNSTIIHHHGLPAERVEIIAQEAAKLALEGILQKPTETLPLATHLERGDHAAEDIGTRAVDEPRAPTQGEDPRSPPAKSKWRARVDRLVRMPVIAGFLVVAVVATLGARSLVIHERSCPQLAQRRPEQRLVCEVARGRPVGSCQAYPSGSAVQLFQNGFMLADFARASHYVLVKKEGTRIHWYRHQSTWLKGSKVDCPGVADADLLRLGFRWSYCSVLPALVREMLGPPLAVETRAWVQYQPWSDGLLIWGIPAHAIRSASEVFQRLGGFFLEKESSQAEGDGTWTIVTEGSAPPAESPYCTSLFYPARVDRSVHELLLDNKGCSRIIGPEAYFAERETCSVFGY